MLLVPPPADPIIITVPVMTATAWAAQLARTVIAWRLVVGPFPRMKERVIGRIQALIRVVRPWIVVSWPIKLVKLFTGSHAARRGGHRHVANHVRPILMDAAAFNAVTRGLRRWLFG